MHCAQILFSFRRRPKSVADVFKGIRKKVSPSLGGMLYVVVIVRVV